MPPLRLPLCILLCALPAIARPAEFVDPAPPDVQPIREIGPPAAEAHKELTFHAAPRPLAKDAVTHDWTGFLGPAHAPVSPEKPLIHDLADLKPVWEVQKGNGYSAPAIAQDRLILFHRIGDEEVIECLHRETGRRYWRFASGTDYVDRYGYTNGPRCAPVIDSQASLLFTLGVQGRLHALDLATGQVRWKRNLLGEFNLDEGFFGVGSTPLLENGLLIINLGAKNACVIAIEAKTGRIKWAAPAPRDWGPSYASPVPATIHGLRRVFVFAGGESRPASGGLLCIDPKTGAVDFSFPWRGRRYESVNASAPLVFDGDKIFISECYGKGGVCLQCTREGDALRHNVLWESTGLQTHFMTALYRDGHLYGCDGHGPYNCPLVCIDAATGGEKWRIEPDLSETLTTADGERQRRQLNTDRCQLLHADGRTWCLTEWGHLVLLDLSAAGCKVTSRRSLFFSGENWTPPVLSHGLLYICQNQRDVHHNKPQRLICYDARRAEPKP